MGEVVFNPHSIPLLYTNQNARKHSQTARSFLSPRGCSTCSSIYHQLCRRSWYLVTPGYKRSDIQLLPSNTTKRAVWTSYVSATETLPMKVAGYRAFCMIWKKYLPNIIITKPASDLCWMCQQNSTKIMRCANKSEEEKSMVNKHVCP